MKALKMKDGLSKYMGWVKLNREILDSPIIKNSILSQVYMWCLLKANHQANWVSLRVGRGIQTVKCEKGQFITGRHKASEELQLPPSTYNSNIKKVKEFGYIDIESNNHYSIITVLNYDCCADTVQSIEQPIEQRKNNEIAPNEQQLNTNNNKNNLKNYKNDNSLNSEKYNKFLSDQIFKKSDKNLFEEYKMLADVILSDLAIVRSLKPPLSPTQLKGLRNEYSFDHIMRKIRDLENWGKLDIKQPILPILKSFLKKEDPLSKESSINSSSIPRVDLTCLFDTDGNSKEEVDKELAIYRDKINWTRFNVSRETWMRKYISKWLRINKYIIGHQLSGLIELKQLTLVEFIIICEKFEIVFSLQDYEFETIKEILNDINLWKDIDDYKTVGKALLFYLKSNEDF